MRTSHVLCAALLSTALSACGLAQRMEAEKQNKELVARSDAALADCEANFPKGNPKIEVARVKCLNDAVLIRMPTFGTDQDLAAAFMAQRLVIAEQMQSGKLSFAEGSAAIAEKWSQAVSQSQQRANARNSVAAQQQTAAAANTAAWAAMAQATKPPPMQPIVNPTITCTHFPGSVTTTCN
jgi:hypothetical protein